MFSVFHKHIHMTWHHGVCRYRVLILWACLSKVCYSNVDFDLFSGGYENFHSQYPELCTEVKTVIDQSGSETEKRVNNHYDKLSHRKPDYDQVWKRKHPCDIRQAALPSFSQHQFPLQCVKTSIGYLLQWAFSLILEGIFMLAIPAGCYTLRYLAKSLYNN